MVLESLIELSYRCNLDCIYCYGKGFESKELAFSQIKEILKILKSQGILYLAFSGGEPLIREDFFKIYAFAKRLGFLISIFSNGTLFDKLTINYFKKYPPYKIEITLNAINHSTYKKITQRNLLASTLKNIKNLVKAHLPLNIKTNLLKQNKEEVILIKKFVEKLLGRSKNGFYFKYDPIILPRLNQDLTPCKYRLTPLEILEVIKKDKDMFTQYKEELNKGFPPKKRPQRFLYQCDSWKEQIYLSPKGKVKFCLFSERFSFDIFKGKFKANLLKMYKKIQAQVFKSNSLCKTCRLRIICAWCPSRAYLEKKDYESPIEYFCDFNRIIWNEEP